MHPGIPKRSLLSNPVFVCLLALIWIFPAWRVHSQVALSGVVTLKSTGKPLQGAHVTIPGTRTGGYTDERGAYQLPFHGKTRVILRVTYVGCNPQERQVNPVNPAERKQDFALEEIPILMGEVEVVDHQSERKELAVPVRMAVISSEIIRDNPGQQITDVLDYVSGINLNGTTGIYGSSQVISMRGLSGNDQGRTLILLDGVPLNKSDGGTVNWNRINRENIGEINVIKGPGPARYGSNAMGGVIEMNSRIPEKVISGNLSASYGTYETFRADYSLGGKLQPGEPKKGLFYNLNGFYTQSAGYNPEIPEYLEPGDTFTTNTYVREAMIGGRAGYLFGKGHQLEAGVEFFNDRRGRGTQIYESTGSYDQHRNYLIRGRYLGDIRNMKWEVSGYYNQEGFSRMNEFMSDGSYNLYLVESSRTDMGSTASFSIQAGKIHELSAGFEFRKGGVFGQDIYYTSTDLITNAGQIELYAGWIQDELRFFQEKLLLNAGLRLNGAVFHDGLFRIEYPSYSVEYLMQFQDTLIPRHSWTDLDPKLSIQYRFNSDTRVYLSIAKGFRAPNLDDLCRSGKRSGAYRIANPALNPENIYNLETGADITLFRMLQLAASVYYSIGYDFMYTVNTGDSVNMGYKIAPILQKRNIGEVHIAGGELDATLSLPARMSLNAGYTYAWSRIVKFGGDPADSAVNLEGKALVDVPAHKITAGFLWNNRILSFNLLYKFVGPRWVNDENIVDPVLGYDRFPAYQTVSIRIWHTFFKKLTLAIDADNIFDVRYIDNRYLQNPGRVILAEIDFNF